jgi:hypothetical protein
MENKMHTLRKQAILKDRKNKYPFHGFSALAQAILGGAKLQRRPLARWKGPRASTIVALSYPKEASSRTRFCESMNPNPSY